MRTLMAIWAALSLTGCASYFTPRPPIFEDRVGLWGKETVAALSTAPDYRVVYVRLSDEAKLCAEAPADAGAQFGSAFAAALTSPLGGTKEISAEAKASLAVALKQLFKRSQGVQFYRDGAFALCNLYLNNGISDKQYFQELQEYRKAAALLIDKEIPYLEKITIDPIVVPTPAAALELKKDAAASSDKKDAATAEASKK
jgi:hypothetical protein